MVHWVVNTNLHREGGYHSLVEALERQETPFTLVDKPAFVDYLVESGREFGDPLVPMTLDIEGPVFVTGTTSMRDVSRNHGWNPGYITAPGQDELLEHYGARLLNHDAVFGKLRDIQVPSQDFFARPVEDTKSFAGEIMNAAHFEDWRKDIIAGGNSLVTLTLNDEIMLAPLKKIYAEYRMYFIDGAYVTGSRYKLGHNVDYQPHVDPKAREFAEMCISEWCPRLAVCFDVAHIEGPEPYKVIETNSISSAGFYACDMNLFVGHINMALENHYGNA